MHITIIPIRDDNLYKMNFSLNFYTRNYKVNAERKSKVDDNTAKMQSIKWLGV